MHVDPVAIRQILNICIAATNLECLLSLRLSSFPCLSFLLHCFFGEPDLSSFFGLWQKPNCEADPYRRD